MILLFAAALAAAVPAAAMTPAPAKLAGCPEVVTPDALVCRALEAQKGGDPQTAAMSFEEAAKASPDKEPATARMWAAAGNLWLSANQPGKAALALDKALALPGLEAEQRGEALIDRARVAESQNDLVTARAKLNEAAPTVADDPFYWYFSASLWLREGNTASAQSAIGKALGMAPADPAILFEAGHVAHLADDDVGARHYWQRAAAADPKGPIGRAAQEALNLLPAPLTVKTDPASPSR
jgi:tetratricopeptide (TPR) repeat protein